MPRTIKTLAPQLPKLAPNNDNYIKKSYDITVVTPLFGGGVEAGKVDTKHPIRETSIRGQLRFWWRATVGQRYETPEKLAEAESELWGSTEKASKVRVKVTKTDKLSYRNHDKNYNFDQNSPKLYALFSAKQNKNNIAKEGFTFNLEIALEKRINIDSPQDAPDQHKKNSEDILKALKAWVNFGGIGARTRRGCGALYCRELSPSENEDILAWLKTNFGEYLNSKKTRPWPTMAHTIIAKKSNPMENIQAWENVISLYKSFRQGKHFRRNEGQERNNPEHSRWPEPDSIRKIATALKSNPTDIDKLVVSAAFGLPIVTKFKDKGDPEETTLYPIYKKEQKERMASSLILKPLAISYHKGIPIVVQLRAPLPETLKIEGEKEISYSVPIPDANVPHQATKYHNSPMGADCFNSGKALEAFISYMKENEFAEVEA
ncbi:type III-B CRISPR module RAMP protein Cmr1 [Aminobacterium sp. MB27-C1]|uniref:type III-B CRISPR module RAMP protein Cmr1 n=1 Tax=Aminobacterium sp. MB27-C1 TaxID=3070661 RepID=UPI0027DE2F49|nr:type III-B CRISPR module RAMP protein Cmr1 [Aminobacterium sp. MB27-C1]WMI71199.1 type III-B CRISPR module RAMP protein Cmr1 [Aminobacterium sp. MB27-C1]